MADEEELTIVIAKRKIRWEPAPVPVPTPEVDPQLIDEFMVDEVVHTKPDIIIESNGTQTFVQAKQTYKKRVGNGHKIDKVRDLYDPEKDLILHDLFLQKNGQIGNDDCVAFKEAHLQMSPVGTSSFKDVAIFQITGYVSVLHTRVAEGSLQLDNLVTYETWMRTKYGETLWARYNLPLYIEIRKQNANLISQGLPPVKAKKVKTNLILTPVKVKADNPLLTSVEGIVIKPSTSPKFTAFRKKWAGA